jgi:hypothetical protein
MGKIAINSWKADQYGSYSDARFGSDLPCRGSVLKCITAKSILKQISMAAILMPDSVLWSRHLGVQWLVFCSHLHRFCRKFNCQLTVDKT